MKTIIAAVDFSPASRNAAYYAADLAARINAELLLVNVIPVPVTAVPEMPECDYVFDKMMESSEEELKMLSDELTARVRTKVSICTRTPVGSVSYSLQDAAIRENAFCIVMGADSTTTIEHLLLENHALAAIHSVRIPVLIIPNKASFKDIKKIVLTSDLRGYENITALQMLKQWLRTFKVKLDVINVVEKAQLRPNQVTGSCTLQKELLEFNPEFHFIYEDEIKEGIDNFVQQNQTDLLITMPGRRSFFGELFHKSESKQLIRDPRIPVLSVYK